MFEDKQKTRMAGSVIFFLCTYFVAPPLFAFLFTRAGPAEIVHAYILWFLLLVGLGMLIGSTSGEKLGWPLILGMFFTTPGIAVMIVILRSTGLRLPLFTF